MLSNSRTEEIESQKGARQDVYRKTFLPQDVRSFSFLLIVGLVLNVLLSRTDSLFLHDQSLLVWVIALRAVFFCFSFVTLVCIRRLDDPVILDRFTLAWSLSMVACVLLINSSRPVEYTGYILIDFCVILALYTLQPGNSFWRFLPAVLFTLGSVLLLLLVKSDQSSLSLISQLSGYLAVNILCFMVSTTWYGYRKSSFLAQAALKDLYQESEQSRRQLEASETFWERIIDTSPNMVVVVDEQRRITRVNKALAERLQRSKKAIIGQCCCQLLCGLNEQHQDCPLGTICQVGTPQYLETVLPALGVETRIRSTLLSEGAEGKPSHVLLLQDISEWKINQDRLREAREAAEKASQVKSDFLALVSHEIRTPLNSLVGLSRLARRTTHKEQLHQYIDIIDQSAHLLMNLVNDVLDMSKVEAGQLHIEAAPFNLVQLLELLRWQFTPLVDNNDGVSMRLELGPGLPAWVVGDATRLRQIVSNLLANAIKFTDNGAVILRVQEEKSGENPTACLLRIEVVDTGIGIDLTKQELLFEPFQQIDPGISRRYGGTGLGLAIVQRLVALMGGSITVQSQVNRGSCFTVRLPVQTCSPVLLAPEDGEQARALSVLVAEDNPFNRLLLKETLHDWGHRVIIAESGRQALKMIERQTFDCYIVDLWMPDLNGLELAKKIRSREVCLQQATTPMIAYTADTDERTRERALSAGMQQVLCKPLDPQKLRLALSDICTGAKTAEIGCEVTEQEDCQAPSLNRYGLAEKVIADMGSDQERVETYAKLLWDDLIAEKNMLDQALLLSDRKRILEAAHSLKGLCGYLDDEQASSFAFELHRGGRELPLVALNKLAQKLNAHLQLPTFSRKDR
nr:ATP-binding protein [uncultured Desulfobulbus sp.]